MDMVIHAVNPRTWEAVVEGWWVKAILGYIVSLRLAQATEQDLISKKEKKKKILRPEARYRKLKV